MSFLLRKRSNLYIADTSSKRTLFLGPEGVRYREVSLNGFLNMNFSLEILANFRFWGASNL